MTILDHTGAAALQRSQILAELAEEGASEKRIKELGGLYAEQRLNELKRRHTIGWEERDGEKHYFLVSSVDSGVERASDTADLPPAGDEEGFVVARPSSVTGSLGTLFELPPTPHYMEDKAA